MEKFAVHVDVHTWWIYELCVLFLKFIKAGMFPWLKFDYMRLMEMTIGLNETNNDDNMTKRD